MKTIFIQFAVALSLFIGGLYYFNRPKTNPQPTLADTPLIYQPFQDPLTETSFIQFNKWLNQMNLKKSNYCYHTLLNQIYIKMKGDEANLTGFLNLNKADFEDFINSFKILPVKDNYIMARNKTDNHPYNIYALFDKTSRLMAFYYDLFELGNSFRYDSLRLEDWNKDGNLELVMNLNYDRSKYYGDFSAHHIEVFDFNSIEHQFIKIFDYELSAKNWSTINYISTTSENKLVFEQPDLIKAVERTTYAADANIKESHSPPNDEEAYQSAIKAQNEYKNTHPVDTTVIVYYQRDKVSKQYVKK
jgi:hypothetical protein